ncbi:Amino acid permease [Prescottella defluvii]|uniref:hypothetical protein n=1 Tax=Prescottella defluvii TaxID=1323361 RepID=UPI0004F2DBB2|nr:hypothetical protein [Prescottella defluvii]
MGWLALVVLGAVISVMVAVLPRRDRLGRASGFPWFWVVFPATCLAVAAALGVFGWPQVVTGAGSYWWDAPSFGPTTRQFLSGEQYQRLVTLRRLRWVLAAVSLAGIALCVRVWRRRRV